MFHFGFSYIGLIWLIMLFVPNIIWTKNKPLGYEEEVIKENKVLLLFERTGQVLVTTLALIFKDFNIDLNRKPSLIILGISFLLMVCYELYWIRYFKSEKTMKDYYSSFLFVPVAGATLPVIAFFFLGLYGANGIFLLAVTILGIGHIGIHVMHRNAAVPNTDKKRKLPIRLIKWLFAGIGCALVLALIGYFGYRNIRFIKAFAGAKNPVFEDRYIELNGQEQYIRVMGKDKDNPVIILLHGGPGGPDGSMDYAYMDYLLDDYTYITWDQRGCGRTYYRNHALDPDNETATDKQLLEDIDALVDYACERFDEDKVTILGHSWGSLLAVRYSFDHPEKIDKTICIGQYVSFRKGEVLAAEKALKRAKEAGDDTSKIEEALKVYQSEPSMLNMLALRNFTGPYNVPDVPERAVLRGAFSPYLGIDDMRWMFIDNASVEKLFKNCKSLIDFMEKMNDVRACGTEFKVPMYFICGEMDVTCETSLAKEYCEDISAPDKAFYEIEGCGHTPQADKPKDVADIIRKLGK